MFDVPMGAPGGGKSKVTSVDCDALVAYVGVTYKKCIKKKDENPEYGDGRD